MIQFVVLLFVVLMLAAVAVAILLSVLMFVAMACAVGIPLWLLYRHWSGGSGLARPRQSAMERLKNLYVEGKIDIFEFERRVAHLLAAERT